MWPVVDAPFEGLLAIDRAAFASWMHLAAVGLGVVGALALSSSGKLLVCLVTVMKLLDTRPVVRGRSRRCDRIHPSPDAVLGPDLASDHPR